MKIKLNTIFKVEVQRQAKSSWPLIKRPRAFLHLVLEHKRRYNSRKENVHQSNKVVEAMGKATVYCIMHTERCVAQVSTAGECKIYFEDFMPYGLVLKESNDFDARINNVIGFHSLSNALVDIALRGHQMAVTNAHLLANDLSTGGCYPKAWVRKDDGFYLYKDGGQDAVEREVLASKICRCFDCHQVLYEQGMFENEPVSISKIMTSQRYSLVTYAAYDVYCTNHDWNTLDKILELDAHGYYMMNILDYLVGNTDRHWENWGLLVDNETNKPVRLHDLMDFNRAFQQYDTLDGANCLTVGKRHLSQREAAVEGVKKTSINQICEVSKNIFDTNDGWDKIYNKRWKVLVESDMK